MDDIASIITPAGIAAMTAIRISGPTSHKIIQKISNLTEKDLNPNSFKLTWIHEDGYKLDQALVLCFKAPRSFTGEDVIEIQCHGGNWLGKRILNLVLKNGARLALPGEFTERAILNNKIDLSQAEGILDLIHSRGELSSSNAVKLYSGKLGVQIKNLRSKLVELLAELTACIDFPDEVSEYSPENFIEQVNKNISEINTLLETAKSGQILREGFKVALAGAPNAGKSSLLNALLNNERAIVTDIAGTTRDIIEESINLNGLTVVFLDTAGIRDSKDKVEQIGIELSKKAIKEADLILWLADITVRQKYPNELSTPPRDPDHGTVAKRANSRLGKTIKVWTKVDLLDTKSQEEILASSADLNEIYISTSKNINLDKLKELIFKKANPELNRTHDINSVSINTRQAELLRKCTSELEKSIQSCKDGLSHDFWTIDLKAAISKLGEITGDDLNEEVLDNMFSQFCIGK